MKRTGQDVAWTDEGRLVVRRRRHAPATSTRPVAVEAEHPLFILYTSGTTGKPKGIFHTTGGYLTQAAYTHLNVFDLKPETDVYWCTADVGWITGHTYVVYGPLINGATQVIYEGTPDTPHRGRWWEIIQKYKVIDPVHRPHGHPYVHEVGRGDPEPVRPVEPARARVGGRADQPRGVDLVPARHRRRQGPDRRHVVADRDRRDHDQPAAGRHRDQAGLGAGRRCPASRRTSSTTRRTRCPTARGGYLVITEPWPSMLRGIWGDPQRYEDTYWSRFQHLYFAGDGAKKDDDGDIWLLGRVDDVMNVSGHRLSTTEIESALVSHPWVAEAAVVGANDETTGQAVVAFVILRGDAGGGDQDADAVQTELRNHVAKAIGPIAKPRQILVVAELPKTRSGKIMRRLLRDVAENRQVGDATTLADSSVMDLIAQGLSAPGREAGGLSRSAAEGGGAQRTRRAERRLSPTSAGGLSRSAGSVRPDAGGLSSRASADASAAAFAGLSASATQPASASSGADDGRGVPAVADPVAEHPDADDARARRPRARTRPPPPCRPTRARAPAGTPGRRRSRTARSRSPAAGRSSPRGRPPRSPRGRRSPHRSTRARRSRRARSAARTGRTPPSARRARPTRRS